MDDERDRLLETAFIEGFVAASDKLGFLTLTGVPFELDAPDGGGLKLMEIRIVESYRVGSASPGFASHELVYHVLPGEMVEHRRRLMLVYVSADGKRELDLARALAWRGDGAAPQA